MTLFYETVFLGGGISCLAAAHAMGGDSLLIEREPRVGGLCRSEERDGFTFDRTGHLLHMRHARTRALIKRLLAHNLVENVRDSWIFSHGVYTRYPFQTNFHGLPPTVAADCLMGFFEAARKPRRALPREENFADWVLSCFGAGVARHFMFPYNRKLWATSPRTLTTGWLGRFVPQPTLREVLLGAVSDQQRVRGYNARFFYPRRGGIEALVRALARRVQRIVTGEAVLQIDLRSRRLRLACGEEIGFGRLISCAPLPELARMTVGLPDRVRAAAAQLRWSSVYNLNLGIRDRGERRHWVYVPEKRFALYRFGYANNFSPLTAPRGYANVYSEVSYNTRRPIDTRATRKRVIADLIAIGAIRSARDIVVEQESVLPYAYAVFDRNRAVAVRTVLRYFESREIYPVGRFGRWEYSSMEDSIFQGLTITDRIINNNI